MADRFVPRQMAAGDRKIALQVLGFGAASKILGNPYPLGGYQGLEIGLSSEYIPVKDLSSLGDKSATRTEVNYYTLSVAKGIFYNIDTVVHFTPAFQQENLSSYGGQLRWGFYDFPFMHGGLSLILHGSATSFSNLIDTRTTGTDLIATFVVEDVALYFGGGDARSIGTFRGGDINGTVTESTTSACNGTTCSDAYEDLNQGHTVFGISLAFAKLYAAFQVDRYYQSTYSAKLGFRF